MAPELGSSAADSGNRRYWERQILWVQWRLNGGWWLEVLQPLIFAAALVFTAVVLVGRREGWSDSTYSLAFSFLIITTAAAAFWKARPRFISHDGARAELEARLGLHSRLSAAHAGIGDWPAIPEEQRKVWRWSWKRLGTVPVISATLCLAAWQVPIPQATSRITPAVKPPALAAVEEWIAELEKNPAIEQSSLDEVKEQAEQLAEQDPAAWYSHASLEAADHLQQQMTSGLQSLDHNASVMQSLLGTERELSQKEAERWNEQMQSALGALSGNVPSLERTLGEQLRQLDPSKLRSLSPDQLQRLQQQLAAARDAARQLPPGEGFNDEEDEEGDGEEGGRGGVQRGPGHAPMKYGAPSDLASTKTEGLESEDFSNASLGDLGGTSDGQHQVDKERQHREQSGGAVLGNGAGPDAVWIQQALRPEERKRLRDFYQ